MKQRFQDEIEYAYLQLMEYRPPLDAVDRTMRSVYAGWSTDIERNHSLCEEQRGGVRKTLKLENGFTKNGLV